MSISNFMKDMNSDKTKRKGRKALKSVEAPSQDTSTEVQPVQDPAQDQAMAEYIANMIQNSVDKYGAIAAKQTQESREDFETLQPIISEFLDDFILIGHTLEGQRVVMRYTATPADLDKLSELCKKVLVKMMIQEQNGN